MARGEICIIPKRARIMPTVHQFLNESQVLPTDRRLILGTIHPPEVENFRIPYFYGNRGNLWDLLSEAFPHLNFNNRQEIIQNLADHQTWISDIIRECTHRGGNAADNQLEGIIYNTEQIRQGLEDSQIDAIYFTSEFTFTLFKQAFHIRLRFNRERREMLIPKRYFGREIKAIVLYSPSDNACRGISRSLSYQEWRMGRNPGSVNEFRVDHYRSKMSFLNHP